MGVNSLGLREKHRGHKSNDYMLRQHEREYLRATERDYREVNPTETRILDFQHLELLRKKFLLFKSPAIWCFVMAAFENESLGSLI